MRLVYDWDKAESKCVAKFQYSRYYRRIKMVVYQQSASLFRKLHSVAPLMGTSHRVCWWFTDIARHGANCVLRSSVNSRDNTFNCTPWPCFHTPFRCSNIFSFPKFKYCFIYILFIAPYRY